MRSLDMDLMGDGTTWLSAESWYAATVCPGWSPTGSSDRSWFIREDTSNLGKVTSCRAICQRVEVYWCIWPWASGPALTTSKKGGNPAYSLPRVVSIVIPEGRHIYRLPQYSQTQYQRPILPICWSLQWCQQNRGTVSANPNYIWWPAGQ